MALEIELADGTVLTFDGEQSDETYTHQIGEDEELVVLRVCNGPAGPSREQEVARYPKNDWISVGELNS